MPSRPWYARPWKGARNKTTPTVFAFIWLAIAVIWVVSAVTIDIGTPFLLACAFASATALLNSWMALATAVWLRGNESVERF